MADTLDNMHHPDATTINDLVTFAEAEFGIWMRDRKNRRVIRHRLEKCGYVSVRNNDAEDGLWKIRNKRQVVYAKATMSIRDQIKAVQDLMP